MPGRIIPISWFLSRWGFYKEVFAPTFFSFPNPPCLFRQSSSETIKYSRANDRRVLRRRNEDLCELQALPEVQAMTPEAREFLKAVGLPVTEENALRVADALQPVIAAMTRKMFNDLHDRLRERE